MNRCLVTLARLLNRPELLDPVRRNLEMTQYLVRANGEIVTEASRRQDQYRIAMLDRYYHAYRHMALHDDSSVFSGLVQFIEETSGHKALAGNLAYFLEDAALLRELPAPVSPVDDFEKSFPHSGMVRIRRGQMDATILDHSDRILTFQKGSAALQGLRLASAFFGKGQFVADSLTHENGAYVLRQSLSGPYYQPLPPEHLPGDGDWAKMPRHLRPTSEVQTLITTITVREANGRVTVHFDVSGTSGVPLAIELAFRKGGKLSGVRSLEDQPDCWLLDDGSGAYQVGDDIVEFGPGKSDHRWTQLRGALPKLDADSVYVTGYTPFEMELGIR